jgi:lipoate-protein ligase B
MERMGTSKPMYVVNLGHTDYRECWDLQRRVFKARGTGAMVDTLLLTEHNHTYTIGRTGDTNHLLEREEDLRARGIRLYFNDRGGGITYHGPGQCVGYPIFDLRGHYLDLHRYLRDLEEVIIRALCPFGLVGRRMEGYTGVWVGGEKICAIGIKSTRWVTMHGFALNVNTDLSFFDGIIPCGIFERGVTSLQKCLGRTIEMLETAREIMAGFESVFGVRVHELVPGELIELLEDCEKDAGEQVMHEVAR